MILAHRVALNGAQLDELDDRINIKSIEEGAGKESVSAVSMSGGIGQRITNRHRDTLEITVKFSITLEEDGQATLEERESLLETINAWAVGGGYLTVNYKPNRRIYVVCAQAPGAGDIYEWTSVYTITFRAYALPYWEEEAAVTGTTAIAASGSVTMAVNGSAETDMEITLANQSGMQINTVTINAAGKKMYFENLGLNGSESLIIAHTITEERRYLQIYIKSGSSTRSAMAKRTAASVDELTVKPGNRSISFSADRACKMTASVRGRFV